jgi:hypothetical protein
LIGFGERKKVIIDLLEGIFVFVRAPWLRGWEAREVTVRGGGGGG